MCKIFIQLNRESDTVFYLLEKLPKAFLLLTLISLRARRISGHPDGLEIGDAKIGDHESCGLTRQEYRTALDHLIGLKLVKIKETCMDRQKSTTTSTTKGTLVTLISSDVYDINSESSNHIINHRATTEQPGTIKNKKEEEEKAKASERLFFDRSLQAFQGISEADMLAWRQAYPHVNLLFELHEMKAWLLSPKGAKREGTRAFIKAWLAKVPVPPKKVEPKIDVLNDEEIDPIIAANIRKSYG